MWLLGAIGVLAVLCGGVDAGDSGRSRSSSGKRSRSGSLTKEGRIIRAKELDRKWDRIGFAQTAKTSVSAPVEAFNTKAGVLLSWRGNDGEDIKKDMRETVINCEDKDVDSNISIVPPGKDYELAYAVGLGKTHGDAEKRKRDVEDAGDDKPVYGWRKASFGFIRKPSHIGFEEIRSIMIDVERSEETPTSEVSDFKDVDPKEIAWFYVYVPKKSGRSESCSSGKRSRSGSRKSYSEMMKETAWGKISDSLNGNIKNASQKIRGKLIHVDGIAMDSVEIFNTKEGVAVGRTGVDFEDLAKEMIDTVLNCDDKNVDSNFGQGVPGKDFEFAYAVGVGRANGGHKARTRAMEKYGLKAPQYRWLKTSFGYILKRIDLQFDHMKSTVMDVTGSEELPPRSAVPDFALSDPAEIAWYYVYVPKK